MLPPHLSSAGLHPPVSLFFSSFVQIDWISTSTCLLFPQVIHSSHVSVPAELLSLHKVSFLSSSFFFSFHSCNSEPEPAGVLWGGVFVSCQGVRRSFFQTNTDSYVNYSTHSTRFFMGHFFLSCFSSRSFVFSTPVSTNFECTVWNCKGVKVNRCKYLPKKSGLLSIKTCRKTDLKNLFLTFNTGKLNLKYPRCLW